MTSLRGNLNWTLVFVLAWLAVVGFGFGVLWRYAHAPGGTLPTPEQWPENTPFARDLQRPTLVMFAHPGCACTQASLSELERLITDVGPDAFSLHVVLCRPDEEPDTWTQGHLRSRVERIGAARIHVDAGGRVGRAFGAITSGTVALYDRNGALLFSGGITASRAHEGSNMGRTLLTRLLRGEAVERAATPVFGCQLVGCEPEDGGG